MTSASSTTKPPGETLTTRQGHPVYDKQNQRTVGARGPATLENYHFIEKLSHFDRERIPERVVHARGATAFGYFEAYGKVRDDELGRRVGEGLGMTADDVRQLPPLATQTLSESELERVRNLGNNGPRDVSGLTMTHCVPNERVALGRGAGRGLRPAH